MRTGDSVRHVAIVAMLVLLTGCAASVPPLPAVAEYPPRKAPAQTTCSDPGFYLLRKSDVPGEHKKPVTILTIYAEHDELLGFRRTDGKLFALAGPSSRPLINAHYTWQPMVAEAQPIAAVSERDSATSGFFQDLVNSVIDACIDGLIDGNDDGDDSGGGDSHHHGSHTYDHPQHEHDKPHDRPRQDHHESDPTTRPNARP